jgi:hypothetical protein
MIADLQGAPTSAYGGRLPVAPQCAPGDDQPIWHGSGTWVNRGCAACSSSRGCLVASPQDRTCIPMFRCSVRRQASACRHRLSMARTIPVDWVSTLRQSRSSFRPLDDRASRGRHAALAVRPLFFSVTASVSRNDHGIVTCIDTCRELWERSVNVHARPTLLPRVVTQLVTQLLNVP